MTLDAQLRALIREIAREVVREELRAWLPQLQAPDPKPWLTIDETAAIMRCSPRTVHRRISVRRLKATQVGRGPVLVCAASVARLLELSTR